MTQLETVDMPQASALQGRPISHRPFVAFRDVLVLAWTQAFQFRLAVAIALLIGIGVAIFTAADLRWSMALIAAVTVTYSASMALGIRALRETAHRSFLYSRPLSASALWWGSLLSGVGVSVALGTATLLPTASITLAGDLNVLALFPMLCVGAPLAFLLPNAFSALAQARTAWRILDAGILALLGGVLAIPANRLWQFGLKGNGPTAVVITLLIALHLGAIIAAHMRATRGRLDSARGHHLFAIALWSFLAIGVIGCWWLARLATSPSIEDLTVTSSELSADGPWHAVAAQDERGTFTSWLRSRRDFRKREPLGFGFVVNEATGEARPLSSFLGFPGGASSPQFNTSSIAIDANAIFWKDYPYDGNAYLMRMDLSTGETTDFLFPFDRYAVWTWWVSSDGTSVVMLGSTWDKTTTPWRQNRSLEVVDLATGRSIARYDVSAGRIGSLKATATWGQARKQVPDIQWTAPRQAAIVGLSEGGVFYRLQLDLDKGSFHQETLIEFDPSALQPSNVAGNYLVRDVTWQQDLEELWLISGNRLLAYANTASTEAQQPARVVLSTESGRRLRHFRRSGDALTIFESSSSNNTGDAVRARTATYQQSTDGLWTRTGEHQMIWNGAPDLQLGEQAFALVQRPFYANQPMTADTVLDLTEGEPRLISSTEWLAARGMPASATLQVTRNRDLYRLDDGSVWRTHTKTFEPTRVLQSTR